MLGATAKLFATTTVLLASFTGLRADSHHEGPKTVGRDRGYGRLPLAFEPNQGQARADVRFISRADGYAVWATTTEAILVFGDPTAPLVRTSFVGANRATVVRGVDPLAGVSNYLIGNDRRQWHTGIPQFGRVRYDGIYPGVDLVLYGNQRQLEYDFVVSPRADPGAIALSIDGADSIGLEANGDLVIATQSRSVRMPRPVAYQDIDGRRRDVSVSYRVRKNTVTFGIGAYDGGSTLVIDPLVVAASTYLGGAGADEPNDLAIDAAGNAYVTGYTTGGFPATTGRPVPGGGYADAFVTKIDASGSSVVYSTVFGGSAFDNAHAIAVDASGAVYVAGGTTSPDFPAVAAIRSTLLGAEDGFVAKLDPSGASFVYSTLLGGSAIDEFTDLALSASGEVYLAGTTTSTDLPAADGAQKSFGGGTFDAFAMKVNAAGSQVMYSTYLGGSGDEYVPSIAVDAGGSAYLVGPTGSADFPIVNGLQPVFHGGFLGDAFVTKLTADGSAFVYSTYLGGAGQDSATDVTVDSSGNVYVVGNTDSYNFPLVGGIAPTNYSSYPDAFVTALDARGTTILFSARLGGSNSDGAIRVALDADRNVYIAGFTSSPDFPVTSGLQSTFSGGGSDGFVIKVNPRGSGVMFSSYLGGSSLDAISGLALGSSGAVYVAGTTTSADFPTRNALQTQSGGDRDVFLTRLTWEPDPVLNADAGPDRLVSANESCTGTVTLDGSRSTTTVGHPITKYIWSSQLGTAIGPTPTFILPRLGTYPFSLTVLNTEPEIAFDSVQVTLADTTPPAIGSATPSPSILWPPNGAMLPVSIALADVTDQCSGPVTCRIEFVTSNEPLAADDWQLAGPLTVQLRADRLGEGTGRVYTIGIRCSDAAGNSASKVVTVRVPHDM